MGYNRTERKGGSGVDKHVEQVGGGVSICVSEAHTFGTDSFLLSWFAAPGSRDTACDFGTGCGVIPLLWYRDGVGPRQAYCVDIQPEAVALLKESIGLSGLEGRVVPLLGDVRALGAKNSLEVGDFRPGGFDVITCNPPYNRTGTGVISREDSHRIARHETLCTLGDVCAGARRLLRFGGRLCLCQLPERLVDVLWAMRRQDIEPKRLRMVHQRAGDAPWLVLAEGKRGAKPGLTIDPPLIMRQGDGESEEMREIYRHYGKV